MNKKVDLNTDLGESFGAYKIGHATISVIPLITVGKRRLRLARRTTASVMAENRTALRRARASPSAHIPDTPTLIGFGRRCADRIRPPT